MYFLKVHSNVQRLIVTVIFDVLYRSVVTVYCILREQKADVYFSRLQCIWKLTDEWAKFALAYETDLY